MTGKNLVKNLAAYLAPHFEIPVYQFDQNGARDLPCIVVGYDSEEQTTEGLIGHFTVGGMVTVEVQGREDLENDLADSLAEEIAELLCDRAALQLAMNTQVPDLRPGKNFRLNRLFVRGTSREDQDSSTFVNVNFDAFTVAKD